MALYTETGQTFPQVTGSSTTSPTISVGAIQILFQQVLCSGKLLTFFASIFGLWPIKWTSQLAIFTIYLVITIICFVPWYNFYLHDASATYCFLVIIWKLLLPILYFLPYLLMFHYNIVSSRKRHVFSLPSAFLKTSNMERLVLNIQFILLCCSFIIYFYVIYCESCTILQQIFQIEFLFISCFGTLLACFLFAVLTCAMHKSASECHIAICNLNEGSLDDVINIHQDLCDRVLATCQALQPWFVKHWLLLGAQSQTVLTILVGYVVVDFSKEPYFSFPTVFLPYLFLLPSLYATRVTRKCQSIIGKINNSRPRDWGDSHPFRKREILNNFVLYANGVSCEYRVLGINFGDTLGWLSFMFSILALGFKLFYHEF